MRICLIFLIFFITASNILADEVYERLHFINPSTEGFYKEFAKIKPFYEEDMKMADNLAGFYTAKERGSDREFLGIDTYDLNGDGKKEIFVSAQNRFECGSHGCAFSIYQIKPDGNLKVILNIIGDAPIVLRSTSYGYHDLAFPEWDGKEDSYGINRWDGNRYVLVKRIKIDELQ